MIADDGMTPGLPLRLLDDIRQKAIGSVGDEMYTKEPGSIASSMGPNKETWERRRVWAVELLSTHNCWGYAPDEVIENAKKLVEYVWPEAMSWGKEPVPPPVSTMVLAKDIKGGSGGPGGATVVVTGAGNGPGSGCGGGSAA